MVAEEGDVGADILQPQKPPEQLQSLSKAMALAQAPLTPLHRWLGQIPGADG